MMNSQDAPLSGRINDTAASLATEFQDTVTAEAVRDLVDRSFSAFADARINDFVPLLVHRHVREQLNAHAKAGERTQVHDLAS